MNNVKVTIGIILIASGMAAILNEGFNVWRVIIFVGGWILLAAAIFWGDDDEPTTPPGI